MINLKVDDLLTCPFCGAKPSIEDWHGGPKTKRMIKCWNEDCAVRPQVAGNTRQSAKSRWNSRIKVKG